MEGDGPGGNPNAALSHPLPLQADSSTADEAITLPESPGERDPSSMGPSTGDQTEEGSQPDHSARALHQHTTPGPAASTKLCGYLHKQGGPLKAWKSRWFTYEEKKSQLFYYRTAQDVTPLGRVELSSATFSYPLQGEEGTFHIQTPVRTFVLKAANCVAKMYWLQQLQLKRWQHRVQLTGDSARPSTDCAATCPDDFLPTIKTPPGLVGETAASLPAPDKGNCLTNMSLKHPLIEIKNSQRRWSQEQSRSVFYWDEPPATPKGPTQDTLTPVVSSTLSVPPPPALLAEPGYEPLERGSPCPSPSLRIGRRKKGSSATMPADRREAGSTDRTSRLQQERNTLAEEVKAQKELVWLLHKALEAAQIEKRTCDQFLAAEGEPGRLELLRHGERQAADLRGRLAGASAERDALRQRLACRDAHVAQLEENVTLMMEKSQAKQEVILKLSEQLAACADAPRPPNGMSLETCRFQQDAENLKDDIEAIKTQNKFLNSEIYQLTKLWRNSSEQEKCLMMKCAGLEASNCQMESRYLGVLRKLQENTALDAGQRETVKKLIEDALQGHVKGVVKLKPIREYDEYGFKIIPDYEVEDMKLLAKIQALEIRSHNLLAQEAEDRPLLGRWTQYLGGRPSEELAPSPELKSLLRAGVPREYRPRVWRWVVRAHTRSLRARHPDRYAQLCQKSRTAPHPASRQIQLDLHRTLTTNQRFSSPSSPALQQLQRVLLAFSWQNPTIGYCQGLNRLAALALLVLQSEEDAFWCLVAVAEFLMPRDYYTNTLVGSQADQRVLKDLMAEKLPRLTAHLEEHSVDVSLITFNWFLVAFVESLPSDILLRVWDAFLYEGTKVIFRYTLALFKYKEEDILKIHDNVEIYQYLRFFTKTITDGRKLTSIAFGDMNPLPMKLLRNRRVLHLERLQAELRELEAQQREYVTESAECKDKDLDTMVSEDDDGM